MLCSKLLPNSSMAPAKLRRHLETVHPECKDKNQDFFVRKKEQLLESQKTMMHVTQTINEKATEASYLVSYRIAQAGEAHTIAENLIKPCVLDITKCMLAKKSAKHVSTVPLSNDTVLRRIHDLASYVKQELVTRLQKARFVLQIDESIDVAGLAILLVIVRYPYENSFEEDMLMCSPLPTNTTGEEIFNKINIFFEENNLSWNDCIDVCTDGAKAMTGNTAGLVSQIKIKAPNCSSSHCILHRQALAIKQMPSNLKLVMDEAVKIINFIKSRQLQSRLFSLLCENYGSKHKTLVLHTEVRWLSRDTPFHLKDRLYDKPWLFRLSFMADIFQKLNELNLSLQELSSDPSMESLFKTTPLNDFWCRIRDEYPMLGKMALNILLPFPTTYLCETGFSTYAATKIKYRKKTGRRT
ncbi:zinc finger BED domain-containing protein 5 [Trichonephila clavipes]|nr:zinc finger BED domain-containing protein 5 [Trichonephila clavipes]